MPACSYMYSRSGWFDSRRPVAEQLTHLSYGCVRRDAEVLSLFAAIISKLREAMGAEVPRIFEAVFECTLQMITKNFEVRCASNKCIQRTSLCTECCTLVNEPQHSANVLFSLIVLSGDAGSCCAHALTQV